MRYFPVNLDLVGKKTLVVGGGKVAYRKTKTLLKCGAEVTVVSPSFSSNFNKLRKIKLLKRRYKKTDLQSTSLVISATDSQEINRQVHQDSLSLKIPVNICDQPDLCTFTLPAIVSKGSLLITISTEGHSPAISRRIREKIEKEIDPVLLKHLDLLKMIRPIVKSGKLTRSKRSALLKRMGSKQVHNFIKKNGVQETKKILLNMLSNATGN